MVLNPRISDLMGVLFSKGLEKEGKAMCHCVVGLIDGWVVVSMTM